MTERQEELAALEALHMLEAEEARVFAGEIKYAPKVVELMEELEAAAGELARLVPSQTPPASCREKIFATIANRPNAAQIDRKKSRIRLVLGTVGWIAAVVLAFAAVQGFRRQHAASSELAASKTAEQKALADSESLRKGKAELEQRLKTAEGQNTSLTAEVAQLKHTNALASLEVASLKALNKSWEDSIAVIVWDNAKQEGVLKLKKMHPASANKDYQLWVVDKDKPEPVSAGVVRVTDQDMTVYTFKPKTPVTASKFAISLEAKGGAERKEGPIIMVGP